MVQQPAGDAGPIFAGRRRGLRDGLLRDLKVTASNPDEATVAYKTALDAANARGVTTAPW